MKLKVVKKKKKKRKFRGLKNKKKIRGLQFLKDNGVPVSAFYIIFTLIKNAENVLVA